jgi:conserved hypothetical protein, proteobacterial
MSKLTYALVVAGLIGSSGVAFADDNPNTFTANVGLYSQYVFRGLTQTNEDPAIQGGFDYAHSSGFYAGVWGSNISWLRDNGSYKNSGSAEIDTYAGYRTTFGDFGLDVGYLRYWYTGDVNPGFIKANTDELYAAGSWKWITVKYSYSLGDTFGVNDAKGTYYLDFSAAYPIADTGITLGAHYGIQKYSGTDPVLPAPMNNDDAYSYDDWKLSATYDLGKLGSKLTGTTLGVAYTDTKNASDFGYGSISQGGVYPKNIADSQVTVWVQKTF